MLGLKEVQIQEFEMQNYYNLYFHFVSHEVFW